MLKKVIERHTRTTIVALEVSVVLYGIQISPRLVLVLLGVPTDRAAEVVEIRLDPFKFLKT